MLFKCCAKVMAAGLLVSCIAGVPGAEARHLGTSPELETKVDTSQRLKIGSSTKVVERGTAQKSLESRIDAILHPPVEEKKIENVKVPTTVSAFDDSIIGTALASQEQCVRYLLSVNPSPNIAVSPKELVAYYYEEGAREGIRPDVAFAQALKETGFFRYGGTVTPMGVRAQIQHLLAYVSTRRPSEPVVDPRYALVRSTYGTRTLSSWQDLNGRWAVPGYTYGQSIMSMFREMLSK